MRRRRRRRCGEPASSFGRCQQQQQQQREPCSGGEQDAAYIDNDSRRAASQRIITSLSIIGPKTFQVATARASTTHLPVTTTTSTAAPVYGLERGIESSRSSPTTIFESRYNSNAVDDKGDDSNGCLFLMKQQQERRIENITPPALWIWISLALEHHFVYCLTMIVPCQQYDYRFHHGGGGLTREATPKEASIILRCQPFFCYGTHDTGAHYADYARGFCITTTNTKDNHRMLTTSTTTTG